MYKHNCEQFFPLSLAFKVSYRCRRTGSHASSLSSTPSVFLTRKARTSVHTAQHSQQEYIVSSFPPPPPPLSLAFKVSYRCRRTGSHTSSLSSTPSVFLTRMARTSVNTAQHSHQEYIVSFYYSTYAYQRSKPPLQIRLEFGTS